MSTLFKRPAHEMGLTEGRRLDPVVGRVGRPIQAVGTGMITHIHRAQVGVRATMGPLNLENCRLTNLISDLLKLYGRRVGG